MIPEFTEKGALPAGIHGATWAEIELRFAYNECRQRLLAGLALAADALEVAGCSVLYLDGSFVTSKEEPGDFDGCWDPRGVDPALLDPVLLDFRPGRLAQKVKYFGELFPSSSYSGPGSPGQPFLEFFQRDKDTGDVKGIIALDLRRPR